jgi:hypothetical protein
MMKVIPKGGSTIKNDGGNNKKRYSMMKVTAKIATDDGELLPAWDRSAAAGCCWELLSSVVIDHPVSRHS